MFLRYLSYKKSWVLLVLSLLMMINALVVLDHGISFSTLSLMYLNVLFLVIFLGFFIWRYKRETAFFYMLQALGEDMEEDWLEAQPHADHPFPDQMIVDFMKSVDGLYKERLRDVKRTQVIENDYITSWIHEIKAPLTAMKITIDSNRSDPLAQKIENNWLRLHLLIDRQLYIARLPTLEKDYVVEQVKVENLLKEEIRDLASWCMEKNMNVEVEQGEEVPEVLTDKKWCRFILRQLLTNAIKYSPDEGTIRVNIGKNKNGAVTLGVHDNGPGIQKHDLPRIFEKGFTGENGRIQNSATGIGLYLAKAVATKLTITLDAESTYGEGTSMYMTFLQEDHTESIRRYML